MTRFRLTLAAVCAALAAPATAQTFPSKPIQIVVPAGAGGALDLTARIMAISLGASLGQPVIIINTAGAGGAVGAAKALGSTADGHTLLIASVAMFANADAGGATPSYDPREAVPVGMLVSSPMHVVVGSGSPHKSLREFADAARAKPGSVTCATSGIGTTSDLACQKLARRLGVEVVRVPYRGSAVAVTDLEGGLVQVMCESETLVAPRLKAGTLRSLAVAQRARSTSFPETPTAEEAGLSFLVDSWTALFVPKGTPQAVVAKLNGALRTALADPQTKDRLQQMGGLPYPDSANTVDASATYVKADLNVWRPIIKGEPFQAASQSAQQPSNAGPTQAQQQQAAADQAREQAAAALARQQAEARAAEQAAALLRQQQQAALAQPQQNAVAPSGGRRVALVIGNAGYQAMPKLVNPKNDAEDIAAALRTSGFDVQLGIDLDRIATENAFAAFSKKARTAETALVYFAGHGIQHNGINYLAPVDARLDEETDLRKLTLLQNVIDDLQGASKVRLLFVDACRDNDAVKQLASRLPRTRAAAFSRGLASAAADGTLIAFATQRDRVAADGGGRNSPFAQALLKHLPTPGLELRTMLTRVRRDVDELTGGSQRPEVSDSLVGEFAFR